MLHRTGNFFCRFPAKQASSLRYLNTSTPKHFMRDGIFKALFLDEKNPKKVISFVDMAMGYSASERIQGPIEFLDPSFPSYIPGGRDIEVDTIFKDPEKGIFIVESQVSDQQGDLRRWEFYLSQAFTMQLQTGDRYAGLSNISLIAIQHYPSSVPNDCYQIKGKDTGVVIPTKTLQVLSTHDIPELLPKDASRLTKWLWLTKFAKLLKSDHDIPPSITTDSDVELVNAARDLIELQKETIRPVMEEKRGVTTWKALSRKLK